MTSSVSAPRARTSSPPAEKTTYVPTHAEQRILPYSQRQLFDLVADVERYPEFLPWCYAARITKRDGDVFYADLVIGFKVFRERFSSKVTLNRWDSVDVRYLKGPMRYLNNHWRFIPQPKPPLESAAVPHPGQACARAGSRFRAGWRAFS